MVGEVDAALADAAAAKDSGADLVEFRIDGVFHGEHDRDCAHNVVRLVDESPLPCIITCRSAEEGGEYDGDDAGRAALWEHLAVVGTADSPLHPKHPPRYIDVELATYRRSANLRQKIHLAVEHDRQPRDLSTSLILSAHDFAGRPANLLRLITEMNASPAARVNKIAWRARSLRDNIEAFETHQHRSRPTIALCMGEFGLMSRVLAPKFGGFLTFASLRDTSATAPGQPTIADLLHLYRFRSIGPATRLYGVIGWPVGHSRSPHIHNAGFDAIGFDGVYLPLPVPPEWEHFKATLHALLDFGPLHFRGASVTLPHKEHLLRFAREDSSRRWEIDAIAARCGAGNTLVVHDDGSCRVMNTDAAAAASVLQTVSAPRIGVLGAGGAARAVAAGMLDAGAEVIVLARRREQADRLVAELSVGGKPDERLRAADWASRAEQGCRMLVNCTPIGMKGGPDEDGSALSLQDLQRLGADCVIFDTIYNPVETPLLRLAHRAGLKTVNGRAMFIGQAAAQFEAWTGRRAPISLFERVLNETGEGEKS